MPGFGTPIRAKGPISHCPCPRLLAGKHIGALSQPLPEGPAFASVSTYMQQVFGLWSWAMLESPQGSLCLSGRTKDGAHLVAVVRINPDQPHLCPAEHRCSSKRFSHPQFFFFWLLRNPGSQNYRAERVSEVEAMCCEQMNISLNISGQNLLSLCSFRSIVMLVA